MNHFTPTLIHECETICSSERLSTYLSMTHSYEKAMDLYLQNMYIASLFMPLLNLTEITLRNRIALSLTAIHGTHWAWKQGFQSSLPISSHFSPRKEMIQLANKHDKTKAIGKVIADSKFAFWSHLLTTRYQKPIWNKYLNYSFPYLNSTQNRATLYTQIEQIRELRNRIAHHEPIFKRDLLDDYHNIRLFLSSCQSIEFLKWLDSHQTISLIQPRITKLNFYK